MAASYDESALDIVAVPGEEPDPLDVITGGEAVRSRAERCSSRLCVHA